MNSLIYFKGSQIRTAGSKDQPLFCAVDVCDMLEIRNSRDAISRLSDKQKGVVTTDTLGGAQNLVFVTEPGLYRLIFQSRKKEAEQFQDWVFERVLPAIRKHGYFVADRDDVPHGASAASLWRDVLQPLGVHLIAEVLIDLDGGFRPSAPQAHELATFCRAG